MTDADLYNLILDSNLNRPEFVFLFVKLFDGSVSEIASQSKPNPIFAGVFVSTGASTEQRRRTQQQRPDAGLFSTIPSERTTASVRKINNSVPKAIFKILPQA